jgi:GalNAc-alpha-(1->4)-GalNAc-alpha-(1->3)-diNAcBac-PP-undecaprenol alpha-1,4-N-acetyl-D-galactosaminyltransferase
LSLRGHSVQLISWDNKNSNTFYEMNKKINWHKLDMGDATIKADWLMRLKRQLAIRKIFKLTRPDVIVAFQHGVFLSSALASLGMHIPIVAAERNSPNRFNFIKAGRYRNLIFQTFRLADCITVQISEYLKDYPRYLHSRIVSIPNPVKKPLLYEEKKKKLQKNLLCVGRLTYQKNQTVLIEAFAQIFHLVPEWRLVFVGDGEDYLKLKRLAYQKKISKNVDFVGAVKNVEKFYCQSDIFCLPSRWEGFPNALVEAMSYGLPVVGYSECDGVRHLIKSEVNGLLAAGNGSSTSLAVTLLRLMKEEDFRELLAAQVIRDAQAFSSVEIFDRWENLLKSLVKKNEITFCN